MRFILLFFIKKKSKTSRQIPTYLLGNYSVGLFVVNQRIRHFLSPEAP